MPSALARCGVQAGSRAARRLGCALLIASCWFVAACGGGRIEPVAAHVVVQVGDETAARDGTVVITPRQEFTVHAVLEAKRRDGEIVYFTEAKGLELAGAPVPAERILPWEGPQFAQVLWLTLEAPRRYAEVRRLAQLESFSFDGFARPDWGRGWVAEAQLALRSEETLDVHANSDVGFGTRFLQAWVELSDQRDAILPEQRVKSPGPEQLMQDPASVTTLVVREAGALGVAQQVFGLAQLEARPLGDAGGTSENSDASPPVTEADRQAIQAALFELQERGLAYSRLGLLRQLVAEQSLSFSDLSWDLVELGAGARWGERVQPGDLLRVGERWVVLFADRGSEGLLDGADLCLDFDKGASVVALSEVFVGEGDLEHTVLRPQ